MVLEVWTCKITPTCPFKYVCNMQCSVTTSMITTNSGPCRNCSKKSVKHAEGNSEGLGHPDTLGLIPPTNLACPWQYALLESWWVQFGARNILRQYVEDKGSMNKDSVSIFLCFQKEPTVWMTRKEMGSEQKL